MILSVDLDHKIIHFHTSKSCVNGFRHLDRDLESGPLTEFRILVKIISKTKNCLIQLINRIKLEHNAENQSNKITSVLFLLICFCGKPHIKKNQMKNGRINCLKCNKRHKKIILKNKQK